MKLWVTGADGLVGSHLKPFAQYATGRKEADIANIQSLRSFVKKNPEITHIANCAAFSLVDLAEAHKSEALQANAEGPENLGIVAKEIGAHIIHLSTDYVFAGDGSCPLKEEDPTSPVNYYGWTKLEGERRLMAVKRDACIIRPSWIFGKGGKNFMANLFHLFQEKEEIQLTNDHWSRPTFAPDLVQIILKMRDAQGLYHFANQGAASKYEFGLHMLQKAVEKGLPVKTKRMIPVPGSTFPSLAKRPRYSVLDTTKIEAYLREEIRPWNI